MKTTAAALVLAASLGIGACEAASENQQGNPDEQGYGSAPEQGQGTAANDTSPFRPGADGGGGGEGPNSGTTEQP